MAEIQARWEGLLSMLSPNSWAFLAANWGCALEKAINSVVQTGVKSPGWENSTTHLPL